MENFSSLSGLSFRSLGEDAACRMRTADMWIEKMQNLIDPEQAPKNNSPTFEQLVQPTPPPSDARFEEHLNLIKTVRTQHRSQPTSSPPPQNIPPMPSETTKGYKYVPREITTKNEENPFREPPTKKFNPPKETQIFGRIRNLVMQTTESATQQQKIPSIPQTDGVSLKKEVVIQQAQSIKPLEQHVEKRVRHISTPKPTKTMPAPQLPPQKPEKLVPVISDDETLEDAEVMTVLPKPLKTANPIPMEPFTRTFPRQSVTESSLNRFAYAEKYVRTKYANQEEESSDEQEPQQEGLQTIYQSISSDSSGLEEMEDKGFQKHTTLPQIQLSDEDSSTLDEGPLIGQLHTPPIKQQASEEEEDYLHSDESFAKEIEQSHSQDEQITETVQDERTQNTFVQAAIDAPSKNESSKNIDHISFDEEEEDHQSSVSKTIPDSLPLEPQSTGKTIRESSGNTSQHKFSFLVEEEEEEYHLSPPSTHSDDDNDEEEQGSPIISSKQIPPSIESSDDEQSHVPEHFSSAEEEDQRVNDSKLNNSDKAIAEPLTSIHENQTPSIQSTSQNKESMDISMSNFADVDIDAEDEAKEQSSESQNSIQDLNTPIQTTKQISMDLSDQKPHPQLPSSSSLKENNESPLKSEQRESSKSIDVSQFSDELPSTSPSITVIEPKITSPAIKDSSISKTQSNSSIKFKVLPIQQTKSNDLLSTTSFKDSISIPSTKSQSTKASPMVEQSSSSDIEEKEEGELELDVSTLTDIPTVRASTTKTSIKSPSKGFDSSMSLSVPKPTTLRDALKTTDEGLIEELSDIEMIPSFTENTTILPDLTDATGKLHSLSDESDEDQDKSSGEILDTNFEDFNLDETNSTDPEFLHLNKPSRPYRPPTHTDFAKIFGSLSPPKKIDQIPEKKKENMTHEGPRVSFTLPPDYVETERTTRRSTSTLSRISRSFGDVFRDSNNGHTQHFGEDFSDSSNTDFSSPMTEGDRLRAYDKDHSDLSLMMTHTQPFNEIFDEYKEAVASDETNRFVELTHEEEDALKEILPVARNLTQRELFDAVCGFTKLTRQDPSVNKIVGNIAAFFNRGFNPMASTQKFSFDPGESEEESSDELFF